MSAAPTEYGSNQAQENKQTFVVCHPLKLYEFVRVLGKGYVIFHLCPLAVPRCFDLYVDIVVLVL